MAVNLSPVGGAAAQFFDNNGIPLAGGLLYTYAAGTSTPLATYTTQQATILNSNPIVLDSAGRVPNEIWLTSTYAYKFVLTNSLGAQVWSYDNLVGINSNFTAYSLQEQTFTATQGQTVFTLSGISYVPGTNNLSVFVNGSKQIVSTNYLETSSTVVTFLTGLNVGDVVDFITAISTSTTATSSNNISYTQGSTGAVTTNVQAKLQQMVSVKDFGAVGDGTTDDSTAINNALAASNNIYFPSGTYLATTITIPNKAIYLKGDGMYETIIQSNTGSYNYLFASAAYVNNATTGNNQLIVENMAFDGNNVCTNVFVLYGFYSEFRYCLFQNALSSGTGAALLVTSNGISGSNCSTTLVENRIVNCRLIANGTSAGLGMVDSGFKCTDMFVLNNIFSGGTSNVVNLLAMAGTIFSNNHVYGGTSSFNELSIGTRIENNYFETKVVVDDFKYPLVSISNNEFLGILQVNFGSGLSYATLVLTDNTFTGASAYILHNFFASSRDIIVMGGSFDSSTPIVWSNGSSTGRVTFNNVYQYATGNYGTGTYSGVGYMLSGSGTAATGNIGKILWQNTYPTTGTWIVGDIVYNTAPTSGGNIGWVCTTSGTPGIWKTFGAIS